MTLLLDKDDHSAEFLLRSFIGDLGIDGSSLILLLSTPFGRPLPFFSVLWTSFPTMSMDDLKDHHPKVSNFWLE